MAAELVTVAMAIEWLESLGYIVELKHPVGDKPSFYNTKPVPAEDLLGALEATVRKARDHRISASYSPEFTEFWKLYPRKENKVAAHKAWLKVTEWSATVTLALSKQLEAGMFSDEPKFIPMASTWLNQQRWENPIVPKRKQAPVRTNVLDEWLED